MARYVGTRTNRYSMRMTLSGERDGLLVDLKRSPMRDYFIKLYLWQATIKSLTINITQRAVTTSLSFSFFLIRARQFIHSVVSVIRFSYTQYMMAFTRLAEIISRARHNTNTIITMTLLPDKRNTSISVLLFVLPLLLLLTRVNNIDGWIFRVSEIARVWSGRSEWSLV